MRTQITNAAATTVDVPGWRGSHRAWLRAVADAATTATDAATSDLSARHDAQCRRRLRGVVATSAAVPKRRNAKRFGRMR
jgi:hypothetical protein